MPCEDHALSLNSHLRACFLMFMVMSLFLSVHVVVVHELEIFISLHCGFDFVCLIILFLICLVIYNEE